MVVRVSASTLAVVLGCSRFSTEDPSQRECESQPRARVPVPEEHPNIIRTNVLLSKKIWEASYLLRLAQLCREQQSGLHKVGRFPLKEKRSSLLNIHFEFTGEIICIAVK